MQIFYSCNLNSNLFFKSDECNSKTFVLILYVTITSTVWANICSNSLTYFWFTVTLWVYFYHFSILYLCPRILSNFNSCDIGSLRRLSVEGIIETVHEKTLLPNSMKNFFSLDIPFAPKSLSSAIREQDLCKLNPVFISEFKMIWLLCLYKKFISKNLILKRITKITITVIWKKI